MSPYPRAEQFLTFAFRRAFPEQTQFSNAVSNYSLWCRWYMNEWLCSIGGMTMTGRDQSTERKPCPTATLSTLNPRREALGIRTWPQWQEFARTKELSDGLRNEPYVSVANILFVQRITAQERPQPHNWQFYLCLYFFPRRAKFSDFSVRTRGRHGKFHMVTFRYGKHEAAGSIQAIIVTIILFKLPDSDRHSE